MRESEDVIAREKISRAMSKPEKYECFVDGEAVDSGDKPVSCILNSISGQKAKVMVAGGHNTGVEIEVPLSSIEVVGESKMNQAAETLFRS